MKTIRIEPKTPALCERTGLMGYDRTTMLFFCKMDKMECPYKSAVVFVQEKPVCLAKLSR